MMKRKKAAIAILIPLALAALILPGFSQKLAVRRYHLTSGKLSGQLRLALLTDLHSCAYGEEMSELISAIEAAQPDLLLLAGDILDNHLPDDNAEMLLQGLKNRYPCYYVSGNHECWSGDRAFAEKMALLERYGVTILAGDWVTAEVGGQTLNLCGVDDPEAVMLETARRSDKRYREQLAAVSAAADNGHYTILLAHRPEFFEDYTGLGFDLVTSGHAHGGQWRIPGLINGVYAPNQGFFPKYVSGTYEKNGTVMIVSRGLARESTRLPRFYNRPELVIIDLEGTKP